MRRLSSIPVLPTMFTLGNLVCGFFAIVVAARVEKPVLPIVDPSDLTNVMFSAWLIFLAMVFDALDGHVARLSRTTSDFGGQLDSLCDVVTFGVAPGFLLVKLCPEFTYRHREMVWIIAAAYAACAALRLARFNVETSAEDDHLYFSGLPSPAAAATIASFAILFYALHNDADWLPRADDLRRWIQTGLPYLALVLALLMVSRIPYPHIVNQLFRGQRTFGHLVSVLFTLVVVMVVRGYSLPVLCLAFVLSGPGRYLWQSFVQRQPQEDSLF